MQRVSCLHRPRGVRLALFVLTLALIASSAFAQRAGRWTGRNSFPSDIEFTVSADGFVTGYNTGLNRETCPSGATGVFGIGRGARIQIIDRSFESDSTIRDGDGGLTVFSGTFTSDTEANGSFYFLTPRFAVQGEEVGCQLCEAESTWTATWRSAAGAAEDQTCVPLDGNQTYFQVTSK